ncbi:MAG: KpsF/GutQ family sugar-phosphate isomerase [Acidobacteriota bacterium]
MSSDPRPPLEVARQVLEIEGRAILSLVDHLGSSFEEAVALIRRHPGRVVCTGMGKSGLILKKVAATLASTGTPSLFLHPAEAIHGDLGMIADGDVVLAASYSGSTEELLRLVEVLQRLAVPMIALTGSSQSPLAQAAQIHLAVPIDREACPLNLAPTASTTATLALADALAMALLEARGFTPEDFARLHPGGRLGKRLLRVGDLMHSEDALPRVHRETTMSDTIYEMSRKGLGITAVVDDDGRLVGCISDGDLRRLLESGAAPLERNAGQCMQPRPQTISADQLAPAALRVLEERRITSLFVTGDNDLLEGLVHLHQLWGLELF